MLAAGSGVLFALLGVVVLALSRRRAPDIAFAAFCVLWGAMIVSGNLSQVAIDDADAQLLTFLYLAFLTVVYAPLLYFSDIYAPPRGRLVSTWWGISLLLAPAAAGAVCLALAPTLLHEGFVGTGLTRADRWGVLFPLFGALFFGSFLWTLRALWSARRQAGSAIERARIGLVIAAFSLYVSFDAAKNLLQSVVSLAERGVSDLEVPLLFGYSLVGVVLLTWLALGWSREGVVGRRVAAWSILLPTTLGLLTVLSRRGVLPAVIEPLGIFRASSVVLLAYATLRYQLFDIDARVKRGAIIAGVLSTSALVALALEQGLERVVGSTGIAITLTQFVLVGGVAVILVKSPVAARALGRRVLPALDAPERLYERRLEVYEAALAHARAAGTHGDLPALRQQLGVSQAEHVLLERLVSGATSRPREPRGPVGGDVVGERYRLERLLGEGSLGAAWLARDEQSGKHLVVKVLHARHAGSETAQRTFLREARLASRLDHPNVIRVLDFGYVGVTPFLAMELAEGGSLEDLLHQGAVPANEARRIVSDTLRGLAHVHAQGVLHRDLKPANILMSRDGSARITDFGIALAAGADDTQMGL
ncbi:MAG: serine/threonine-protein kinase, partial [Candidatus Thermoplasmatota archaeon]